MIARIAAMLLLAVSCGAQGQDSVSTVTRSTGAMQASTVAQSELGLPDGSFDYEVVATSTFARAAMQGYDPATSFYASGSGSVALTMNGVSQAFRDITGWAVSSGQFGSSLSWRGTTDFFQRRDYRHLLRHRPVRLPAQMKDACGAGAERLMSRIFTVRRDFL